MSMFSLCFNCRTLVLFFVIGRDSESDCKACHPAKHLISPRFSAGKVQILDELAPFERFKIAEALEVGRVYLSAHLHINEDAQMQQHSVSIVCECGLLALAPFAYAFVLSALSPICVREQ